jgi:hypothetical protein
MTTRELAAALARVTSSPQLLTADTGSGGLPGSAWWSLFCSDADLQTLRAALRRFRELDNGADEPQDQVTP